MKPALNSLKVCGKDTVPGDLAGLDVVPDVLDQVQVCHLEWSLLCDVLVARVTEAVRRAGSPKEKQRDLIF